MFDQVMHGYVSAMKCEHREIGKMLHALELNLDEATSKAWTVEAAKPVLEQLDQLEACLVEHFKREEAGGFLEEAMAVAPRFGSEAEGLLDEHTLILKRVGELKAAGKRNLRAKADWQTFAAGLRNTIRFVLSHETRENNLLQRAFNVANGA